MSGAHWLSLSVKALVIYLGVAFMGGTLINTGNPGAVIVGSTLHTMIMINPVIRWADAHDQDELLGILITVADGAGRPRLS